jgi:NifU-like protein
VTQLTPQNACHGEIDNASTREIRKPTSGLTNLQRIKRIEELLDEIRSNLQRDQGDVELVEVDGRYIYVNVIGACAGCQMAATTLGGVQQHLADGLGEFVQVLPAEELARGASMGD